MKRLQNPVNKLFSFIIAVFLFVFYGCSSNTIVKLDQEINLYQIQGYISSKKDRMSFDVKIHIDILKGFYEIRGFDTLLSKERFLVYYKDKTWFFKDYETKEEGKLDENVNFLEALPPLAYFDYLSFFQGQIPVLKNAQRQTSNQSEIYTQGDFVQKIEFSQKEPDKKLVEKIIFYHKNEKIYQFEYQNYVFAGNRIFPKSMNIIDYQKKKKIVWWFNQIKTGGF